MTTRSPADRVLGNLRGTTPQEAQDWSRALRAGDSMAASRRSSLRARAGMAQEAAEPMACPACRKQFDFGDLCPSCDVALVGLSAIDSAPPEPPAHLQQISANRLSILLICSISGLIAVLGRWMLSNL